jgi:hypothetical protein
MVADIITVEGSMQKDKDIGWGTFWLVLLVLVIATMGVLEHPIVKKPECVIEQTK